MAVYRFGAFEFDSETGELQRTGRRARLRPQPARILEHLLQRPGEFVSRGELQRVIWPEGTFVHYDDGLNSCLKQIRAALGGRRGAAEYVETLVRRGFRFIAPVTMAPAPARLQPGEETLARLAEASPAEVALVDNDLAGFLATLDADVPVHFLLAVTVRITGTQLHVTSTLVDARSPVPDTAVSSTVAAYLDGRSS